MGGISRSQTVSGKPQSLAHAVLIGGRNDVRQRKKPSPELLNMSNTPSVKEPCPSLWRRSQAIRKLDVGLRRGCVIALILCFSWAGFSTCRVLLVFSESYLCFLVIMFMTLALSDPTFSPHFGFAAAPPSLRPWHLPENGELPSGREQVAAPTEGVA